MNKTLVALLVAGAAMMPALAQQTIKLGVVTMDAGPFAVSARPIGDGAAFAVEQLNARGGALGRRYELVVQAHDGTPAAAVSAVTRLVSQGGVSFFTGLNSSGHSMAIVPKLEGLNALFVDATAGSDDLTGKSCHPNYFRVGLNDSAQVNVLSELATRSGVKSWDLMLADIAAAHDSSRKFAAAVPAAGGTVQKTLFAPIATSDFGSHVTQLQNRQAEGLFVHFPGSGGIALAKQQAAFGVFEKYKVVLSMTLVNEVLIDGQGDATVGAWSTQTYFHTMPGSTNAEFVKAFEARFKRKPTYLDVDAYLAFQMVHEAIVKAGSSDVAAVRKALNGLKANTVVGEVEMRAADHQLLRPVVVVQAVRAAPGKGEIVLRSVEPVAKATPPVSPACRMAG